VAITKENRPTQHVAGAVKHWSGRAFCGLAIFALLHPLCASASTATASIAVSATVLSSCTIGATTLAFGNYTGVVNNQTATLSVNCTNSTAYTVGLSAGSGTGATTASRKMTGPSAALLNYALYSDSARSVNWGNAIGTDTTAGTGNGSAQSLTVYGQVSASQAPTPGGYTDSIVATLTY
jgi:spore coat protein U-like protein